MDAFELVRQSASRLHGELASRGADPFKPLEMVEAAFRHVDVNLFWLPAGDPALKGAQGVFDEQSGTVCCEVSGTSGERALVAAHELGHACVHVGSSSCAAHDIDPSRSTEAAPVGLQRVEDYGTRERRELQANVFAREFLLPRALARRLHVEQSVGAADISDRTGLPKNPVRQQLFDALLLPAPPLNEQDEDTGARSSVRSPDVSQERAAMHRGSPFQLQAGPGTGKTQTLVDRALGLLAEGIDPAAILVLTFSNRAAGELAKRLVASAPEKASRIWIGTFHAFGLDLIRRYHDRLGLSSDPPLFDRSDAIEVLEELLPTLPLVHYRNLWDPEMTLREVIGAISRAKDEVTDPVRYRALADDMRVRATDEDEQTAAEKSLEIAQIYEFYERAMHDRGAVDFGDLIMRPALLLESDPRLQRAVQVRHRHVLVDEYQDVNRASARFLQAVVGDGTRLWVVGDARQSIYRFRGASSTNMPAFGRDHPNATIDRLTVNYRSTEQIVRAFTAISPHLGASNGMLPLVLSSERGSGPALPEIRRYDTLDDEAAGVASSIRQLEAAGVRLRDQAVLCRSNARLNEIAAALENRGIPVLHLGSLFERDEVRELLSLLSLAVDRYGDGLVRVGSMRRYRISIQDVYFATRYLREADRPALEGISQLQQAQNISNEGRASFARLASDLQGLRTSSSAWDFLATYLLDATDFTRSMADGTSVSDRMRAVAVWQFLNFARERSPIGSGPPIKRTLDRVRQMVLLAEERDLRQVPMGALHMDAVRLMTVHGSKGLEFEAVHFPGLTVSSVPTNFRGQRCPPPVGMIANDGSLTVSEQARQDHNEEEECLFFVAVSRARTHLRLYLARRQPNGKNRTESPFLAWIPGEMVREIVNPTTLALPDGASQPVPLVVRNLPTVTDSRLGLYEKCPRRFCYTHVLGLSAGRKATAFSRTHDCLYEFIDWLADTRHIQEPTLEQAEEEFERIWRGRGPIAHGFVHDYRRLASRLVAALIRSGAGRRFRRAEPIAINLRTGQVIVEPSELAELPNGTVALRRLRTGHKRDKEYDRLEYTLYELAGQTAYTRDYVIEAVHLTDETQEQVTITAEKLSTRRRKAETMLADIAQGVFPVEIDAVTCPRCPHFFICPAIPVGPLTLS